MKACKNNLSNNNGDSGGSDAIAISLSKFSPGGFLVMSFKLKSKSSFKKCNINIGVKKLK